MTPRALLVHSVPGRLRLKIPDKRRDHDYFQRLQNELQTLEGVIELSLNAYTASALIGHDWPSDEILLHFAERTGLFVLDPAPFEPMWRRASVRLEQWDRRLATLTRGEVGVRSVLMLVTLLLGLRQAMRGQTLGPASNLLWYALTLAGIPEELPRPLRVQSPELEGAGQQ